MSCRLLIAFLLLARVCWAVNAFDENGGKVWDYYQEVYEWGYGCHYYRMDATSGSTETDVGRVTTSPCNSHSNGTYSNGFTLAQVGSLKSNPSLSVSFDGTSGTKMAVSANSDMLFPTANGDGWAVEFWGKTSAGTGYYMAAYSNHVTTAGDNYVWYVYNNSGAMLFATKTADILPLGPCQTTMLTATGGSSINDGAWHYFGVSTISDGSGQFSTLSLYLDGVEIAGPTPPSQSGTVCDNFAEFGTNQLENTGRLAGSLDEISFYRRTGGNALTAAEAKNHYLAGLKSDHHGPAHVQ